MKMSPTALLLIAVLAFVAGYWWRGHDVEPERRALQDIAAQARLAAQHADTRRAADRAAFDAERAEMTARVTALQQRARTLGTAATRLMDTVEVAAPDTCIPGLQRIRFAWSLHMEADRVADSTYRVTLVNYDRAVLNERIRTAEVMVERDTAQARLTRALRLPPRRSGFVAGALVGGGVVLAVMTLAR